MARRTELSSLELHLGYWIRSVSNHVSHAFALKLAAVGVTVAEWVVLRELYDSENAPSALADRLGMTRGAISKLADRLIDKEHDRKTRHRRRPPLPVARAHPPGARDHAEARRFGG